jgi:acyl carrier protein
VSIAQTIKNVLVNELFVEIPPDQMAEHDSLRNAFGLDSVGFVELRVQCEELFDITIPDADFTPENFSSIQNLVALVERLVAAKAVDERV